MTIIIPKRELLESHLEERGQLKKDKLMYVLHIIKSGLNEDRNCFQDKREDRTFVRLDSQLLRKNLGNDYLKYMEFWLKHEVITLNPKYSRKNFSKSYTLDKKYMDDFDWYTITDFTFKRRIENNRIETKEYPSLRKHIELLKMDIGPAKIEAQKINEKIQRDLKKIEKERCKLGSYLLKIETFNETRTNFSVDESGYRLHTKLTRSNRILRPYITYKDSQLVEVDMSNSQFYFLLYLLDKKNWRITKDIRNLFKDYNIYLNNSFTSNIYTIIDEIHASGEFEEYKKMVSEEKIYDHFTKLLQERTPTIKRDRVKKLMIIAQFSKNGKRPSKMKKLFEHQFPNIYKLICAIKGNEQSKKEKKHSVMAILLQRIESEMILNKVARRISKEMPKLPIFTIHDCLVTTLGNENYVKDILEQECLGLIEVLPTTKFKYWQLEETNTKVLKMGTTKAA